MRGQLIAMGMGMGVVPGSEVCFFLRMVPGMGVRMIHGMVLVQFTLPVLVRAGLGPGLGRLGIVMLAIWPVSGGHNQYFLSW